VQNVSDRKAIIVEQTNANIASVLHDGDKLNLSERERDELFIA
jgi:hypothetical protein